MKYSQIKIWSYIINCIIFCFATSLITVQQITTDSSQTLQELIENNLVSGCVEVSNISSSVNGTVNGFSSYGYFEKSTSNFPFENGIILSSGNIASAGNTANDSHLNEGDTTWQTDPDLETTLGINNTLNATSIQFDFRSGTDAIQFNYILASEEYLNEYPCNYSDGFAFLIKEAGTSNPYQNIALIPGTTIPVNTNTIHNEIVGFCDAENETYFAGNNIGDTNFNGRTTVLSASASITPDVVYNIKLIIADQTDRNFDSAVFIQGNSFTNNIDLGTDISTCNDSVTLNANTNNPNATYAWFQDENEIAGETSSDLLVNISGTYRVEISVPLNGNSCTFTDDINITLNSIETGPTISDFEHCDDSSNDGVENFDLTTQNDVFTATLPASTYQISYHLSNQDAIDNINPITNDTSYPNAANPETLHVRITDTNNGCVYISTLNLIVNPFPIITAPSTVEVCDNNSITLTDYDSTITNNNANLSVTYHHTQNDANTVSNPINSPYSPSNNETLIVSVVDINTGCQTFTNLPIETYQSPNVNQEIQQLNACEQDDDGFEFFDLTTIIDDVLQGETNVNVTFHITNQDAQNGINAIQDPTQFENTEEEFQIIYIRIENDDNSCFTVVPLELHTNILHTGTNIQDFNTCDTNPDDGIADFDLIAITDDIANDLEDITITYYETQTDLDNSTNPVDDSVPYSVNTSQTLFILIEDLDCSYPSEIELTVDPSTTIETSPVTYCDTDDDGFTSIELATFNDSFTSNITNPTIQYFETQANAEANTGQLNPFYTNTTNPLTLYVRATNTETGCYGISSLDIEVLLAPSTNTPSGFIICNQDQDTFSTVDLTSKIPEITSNTSGLDIRFFTTSLNANNETNEITNSTAYNTQSTTVFTRVENTNTGCYSIEPISILINTIPIVTTIDNIGKCDENGNSTASFIFSNYDDDILNGQTDKQVLYFETENNAINNTSPIDKDNSYTNTTQTQTIYVRIENLTDANCYVTTSFDITVDSTPIYNEPEDVFVCDDMSNDGIETFNLNEVRDAIILNSPENLTVTFYLSSAEAINLENPLDDTFTTTQNPQDIFVNIDNDSYCDAVTSFSYNIIQVPEISLAPDIETCDTDLDGLSVFDLTTVESEVLGIRQDDIEIAYFENEMDLESNSNQIPYPTNYSNTSNPQTAYIQVTNTVSNCSVSTAIELIVNLPPEIAMLSIIESCETDDSIFNLNTTIPDLIGNQQNVVTTFYSNMQDAEMNENPLDPNYNYATTSDTIYVRAEFSNTNCYNTSSFTLQLLPLPTANPVEDLETCDDNFNNQEIFDLSQQTPIVLGTQNPNNFSVSYFISQTNAVNNENAISNLNVNVENQQTFYIRIENNTTHCFAITNFNAIVHRKPNVNIDNMVVCLDNLPLVVSAETNTTSDTYLWSSGATTSSIEITQIGTYSVTVTSSFGCTTTSSFNVTESEPATIDFVENIAFSNPHNITITVSGIGNYLYQLDDQEPQTSPFFGNVAIGPHTITVIDINGCNTTTKNIIVIDAPLYVTPNGDGFSDTWHITGVEQLPGTIIYIFNRYGKLLTTLKHNSRGWDGTYNGHIMPASDYWFLAKVVNGEKKFDVKGHFSLRR